MKKISTLLSLIACILILGIMKANAQQQINLVMAGDSSFTPHCLVPDSIELDLYGSGSLNIFDDRIRYKGLIPFGQSQAFIAGYDLLVLPSYHDGWGVVVNEAICAGVPVVCSDQVGARLILKTFGVGKIFSHNKSNSLRSILSAMVDDASILRDMRVLCAVAADAIQPSVAANYMFNIIQASNDNKCAVSNLWQKRR